MYFSTTLSKSSIGELACDFNFKSCTGSFHGATHNHLCQLCYHIGYKEGAGIEDGEGNECLFSASNALATVTCHSTAFNQCQCMHIHFEEWDQDKYEHLGMYLTLHLLHMAHYSLADFMTNKYSTAMELIKEST